MSIKTLTWCTHLLAFLYGSMIFQVQIITHYRSTFHDASNNVSLYTISSIHGHNYKSLTAKNLKTISIHFGSDGVLVLCAKAL